MLTATDDAEVFEFIGQISGKLAVGELMTDRNLIHGTRHGTREILDELSVFTFVRVFEEVAPKGLGDGPYLFVGLSMMFTCDSLPLEGSGVAEFI